MTTQRLLFPLLTVGLEKYLRQDRPYPYPQELQHAMNLLVLELRDAYPTTFAAFLALMEQPPEIWYQGDALPNGLDKRVSLLYRGQLNELTEDYLIAEDLSGLNLETLITQLSSPAWEDTTDLRLKGTTTGLISDRSKAAMRPSSPPVRTVAPDGCGRGSCRR